MKTSIATFALAFCLVLMASCKKDKAVLKFEIEDCGALSTAMLENDDATVDAIMDGICAKFPPKVTDDDTYGHRSNLDAIIEGLNEECPELHASFGCYACLESLPPWSIIKFSLDSSGIVVERYASLLTPSDGAMRSNW